MNKTKIALKPINYDICGLKNILIYGLEMADDSGEQVFVIPQILQLHQLIATDIVSHKVLNCDSFKFLRCELELTTDQLAEQLAVDEQNILNWESDASNAPIPAKIQNALRELAIEKLALKPLIKNTKRRATDKIKLQYCKDSGYKIAM